MRMDAIFEINKRVMLLRRGIIHHLLTQYGLHPGQPEMLRFVQQHPGCSQREMAEDAGVSAASIAASFRRMENAGLIRRRSDTSDLRCNRVYITERGEDALKSCMDDMLKLNDVMLRALSEEELAGFLECLRKISDSLHAMKECRSGKTEGELSDHLNQGEWT